MIGPGNGASLYFQGRFGIYLGALWLCGFADDDILFGVAETDQYPEPYFLSLTLTYTLTHSPIQLITFPIRSAIER